MFLRTILLTHKCGTLLQDVIDLAVDAFSRLKSAPRLSEKNTTKANMELQKRQRRSGCKWPSPYLF
jgi:hypothetical protein